jgi:hypothetical protein
MGEKHCTLRVIGCSIYNYSMFCLTVKNLPGVEPETCVTRNLQQTKKRKLSSPTFASLWHTAHWKNVYLILNGTAILFALKRK